MGEIILGGLIREGMCVATDVMIFDAVMDKADDVSEALGVVAASDPADVARECDMIFLCVKPDQFASLAKSIRNVLNVRDDKPCFVSIMAGVKTDRIMDALGWDDLAVIRVMPNVACTVGRGMAGIAASDEAEDETNEFVFDLFEKLGGAVWVKEKQMDAVTAVSGSGPAYVFMFIEALTDAGVMIGLDRATSQKLAVRTLAGATEMVNQELGDTLTLRAQVSSPGGTTAAATTALEKFGFRNAVIEAVTAAWKKSIELGS